MTTKQCYGCKGRYPERTDIEAYATYGAGRYGVAIPECMAALSEVLVRENQLFGYPQPAHRLIVDAVGLQHPPHADIQNKLNIAPRLVAASVQSIWVHGLALYCIFEKNMNGDQARMAMKKTLDAMNKQGHAFEEIEAPSNLGEIKAIDVRNAVMAKELSLEEYTQLAYQWAESAWNAWEEQHTAIEKLYEKYK